MRRHKVPRCVDRGAACCPRQRPSHGAIIAAALAVLVSACAPTVAEMGPAVIEPSFGDSKLIMADGAELPLHRWGPSATPRAVILALHGFNETGKSFALPGETWAKAGITTYAYDQRGFGAAPNHGLWPGTATLVADLDVACRLVAARHPDTPLFVLGESMGGAVVMVAFAEGLAAPTKGAILVAPAVRGRPTLNIFARAGLWLFAHTIPWLAGRPGNLGIRPTDNIEALRALSNDPLVIKDTRIDAVWGLVNLMDDALAAAPMLDRQSLILLGARDDLVPGEPNELLLRLLPPAGRETRRIAEYSNGYHMLLRDLQATLVQRDVAHWIATRDADPTAPLPSGAEIRIRPPGHSASADD